MQEVCDRGDLIRRLIGRNPFTGQSGDIRRRTRTDLAAHDDTDDISAAGRNAARNARPAFNMDREGSVLLFRGNHGNIPAPGLADGTLGGLYILQFDQRELVVRKRVR